ncbi:hypothetical protein [uncultured Gammaproteobacteria bacterium]|jgi:hypothetical protein|nr:hypothetical protein [uncultured Gammaproteobacteria bacterium]
MFFKNKHIITSLIVAPILALISYFAVDYYVAEVPHKAKQGQAYKMLVKSNCRWESGMCDLINGDLKINITSDTQTYGLNRLFINASNGLKGIKFAVVEKKNKTSEPHSMMVLDALYTSWQSPQMDIAESDYLQFVISVNESVFYVEIPAIFIYKVPFL